MRDLELMEDELRAAHTAGLVKMLKDTSPHVRKPAQEALLKMSKAEPSLLNVDQQRELKASTSWIGFVSKVGVDGACLLPPKRA